ncbi:MAG: hypothetical protein ACI4BH_01310 [Muribaculaceae bacterium]
MSDFNYALYPIIDISQVIQSQCLNFGLTCKIYGNDGEAISPKDVIGKELLLAYSIDACNAYGRERA